MKSPHLSRLLRIFAAVSVACIGLPASAFFIPQIATRTVTEFYNVGLGHYFMTADGQEVQDIEAGKSGPGWVRTGWTFTAYAVAPGFSEYCTESCGPSVARFYGPGPNSHFFTADPTEAAGLKQPGTGWLYERDEFRIPLPNADGTCRGLVPVRRFYNNRWTSNDSNHRYVTDDAEAQRMRERGWVDEGVRFCAAAAATAPVARFDYLALPTVKILPSAQCEDPSINLGSCVAINNLTPPTYRLPIVYFTDVPPELFQRTGLNSSVDYVLAPGSGTYMAQNLFVQPAYQTVGIHVETATRGGSSFSSVNPLYQFPLEPGPVDKRFFPFARYESALELAVGFTANVKTLRTGAGSHAYGHPTLEFVDRRSGKHLYFTVATYGTVDPEPFVARDTATGRVIVSTVFGQAGPYGRSLGLGYLRTPAPFTSDNSWGWGGPFEFRMDALEFQRVLDAARALEPGLSADRTDYFMANFHFNNEVVGEGEIGLNLADFRLQLLLRR